MTTSFVGNARFPSFELEGEMNLVFVPNEDLEAVPSEFSVFGVLSDRAEEPTVFNGSLTGRWENAGDFHVGPMTTDNFLKGTIAFSGGMEAPGEAPIEPHRRNYFEDVFGKIESSLESIDRPSR